MKIILVIALSLCVVAGYVNGLELPKIKFPVLKADSTSETSEAADSSNFLSGVLKIAQILILKPISAIIKNFLPLLLAGKFIEALALLFGPILGLITIFVFLLFSGGDFKSIIDLIENAN